MKLKTLAMHRRLAQIQQEAVLTEDAGIVEPLQLLVKESNPLLSLSLGENLKSLH